jgi:UDP-hydrolysing UDP-N-acetyl-D-glucosamine 2-epimerase
MTRRICIVTGSRADYGLLRWLMHDLRLDPAARLQILATGMHLSPEYGLTYREIEADGFAIDQRVEIGLADDSALGIAESVGRGVAGCAKAFERLRPDIVVLLGDRFEILAAAEAAMLARLPLAHIHGGEASEGAIDEAIRHAITKMAHLHFVAAEPYRRRIIRMGEHPDRVVTVGAPGLDALQRLRLLGRAELAAALGYAWRSINLLVTYHPATLSRPPPSIAMGELLGALAAVPDAGIVFTKPNADHDGRVIAAMIDEFCAAHAARARAYVSLGQLNYLSLMAECSAVIGNSSSGIIEAPALGRPTVNIGARQRGRLRAPSVIDCADAVGAIEAAIGRALDPAFQRIAAARVSPYGGGGAAAAMKRVLLAAPLDRILVKSFYEGEPDPG